jgi:hypothetical protein
VSHFKGLAFFKRADSSLSLFCGRRGSPLMCVCGRMVENFNRYYFYNNHFLVTVCYFLAYLHKCQQILCLSMFCNISCHAKEDVFKGITGNSKVSHVIVAFRCTDNKCSYIRQFTCNIYKAFKTDCYWKQHNYMNIFNVLQYSIIIWTAVAQNINTLIKICKMNL